MVASATSRAPCHKREGAVHKLGLDLGKSMVKATVNGNTVVEFPPLVAAPGSTAVISGGSQHGRSEIQWEGLRYLVGESVRAGAAARWITDERKIGQDTMILALAALGAVGVQGDVTLCVGVPAALWGTDGQTLQQMLSGSYQYTFNGHERALRLTAAVLPEPVGTYLYVTLTTAGRISDPTLESAPVAVVDIGYRTVDIVVVQGNTVHHGATRSSPHGVVNAFEPVYREIEGHVGILTDDERMDVFLSVVRSRPITLKGREVRIDVDGVMHAAKLDLAEAVIGDVRSALSGVNYRVLLWTGGGAAWLRPECERAFPGTRWADEPRWANVRGFYRGAVRLAANTGAAKAGSAVRA